ncbi:Nmad3 family putative nucleotide modification protein [Marinobacterium arenosum]|uniref:Nmad3 family putative nucleotide modification protein n=1 Tax=Marinobacterium arenosum TaxID=2862496 RepID=UPI001C974357|nr:hypothetical protein [Marinobacterium arenosum]MBY4677780.1 hypothetical protein [Marinobacterium arenosum]
MKIILSRKGFDSSAGGIPSPVLPDGRLLPLPIPQADGPVRFSELRHAGQTLSSLIKQLGGKQWRGGCHLDPDLVPTLLERPAGWLPSFGQSGAAQRHLEQERVAQGDLFLFFGWFRQAECYRGRWRFVSGAPDLHLLYGWLQVGEICSVDSNLAQRYPALVRHPHLNKRYPFNTLYLPTERLSLFGRPTELPGAGQFERLRESHRLTWPGENRSTWRLPDCFAPQNCHRVLSYHRQPWRWQARDDGLQLQAAYRGQEFVVESDDLSGVQAWLATLGLADGVS